ncbi:photoactive yellow protein [Spirochaeta lutea]|uniref:Photoactive yellow protein n=1 Tax=Spirochaeta lutea TaxID=1480694 RepID=A0A098QU42_9SPIO|nr:photoactive yellow protein [Spirochaeta lutea]KGE71249.1 phosphonate transporter [Spirochaeta lutea]
MEVINFGSQDMGNVMAKLGDGKIDDLAFGAIKLDKDGTILSYNQAEGAITGRDPQEVIGKNFFTQVAPCTNQPGFFGKFQDGVAKNELNTMFEYVFDYKMQPTKVKVHMMKAQIGEGYYIFVKRI